MIVSIINGNKLLQAQFTDDEWITVDWVLTTYGPNAFKDALDKFVQSRALQKLDTDKAVLFDAFDKAAKKDKDDVISSLKLNGKIK